MEEYKCIAICKKGQRCMNYAIESKSGYCRVHRNYIPDDYYDFDGCCIGIKTNGKRCRNQTVVKDVCKIHISQSVISDEDYSIQVEVKRISDEERKKDIYHKWCNATGTSIDKPSKLPEYVSYRNVPSSTFVCMYNLGKLDKYVLEEDCRSRCEVCTVYQPIDRYWDCPLVPMVKIDTTGKTICVYCMNAIRNNCPVPDMKEFIERLINV